jgi:peptide subunit release factor 1 (eRF1)
MFSEKDLQELIQINAPEQVLSVYLNTEPSKGNADAYRLRLRTMLKNITLTDDAAAIERFFNQDYDWNGRSVALFSCTAQKFFRAFPLAIPVHDQVYVGDHPFVKELTCLLDTYGGYGVVIVDKQGARFFSFHLGELTEQDGYLGEPVKHVKHGGASSFPGRRGGVAGQTQKAEELVDRNRKDIVESAIHFFEENHIRRILIGGTEENIISFRSQLSKAWQSLVYGTFSIAMTAPHDEVLQHALEIGMRAEHEREARMVSQLITSAAKGQNAVMGVSAILSALHDGRIQTLVLAEGYQSPGHTCPSCHYLTVQETETCPNCDHILHPTNDVIEPAVSKTLRMGGEVEVVMTNPELVRSGGVGALLRY